MCRCGWGAAASDAAAAEHRLEATTMHATRVVDHSPPSVDAASTQTVSPPPLPVNHDRHPVVQQPGDGRGLLPPVCREQKVNGVVVQVRSVGQVRVDHAADGRFPVWVVVGWG